VGHHWSRSADKILDPVLDPVQDPMLGPVLDPTLNPGFDCALEPVVDAVLNPVVDQVLHPALDQVFDAGIWSGIWVESRDASCVEGSGKDSGVGFGFDSGKDSSVESF